MHWLARRNPSGLDLRYRNRIPFLDVADDDNDDDSTKNETDDEGNEIDDSDNNPPPSHNATPISVGATETDLRNLRRKAGFQNNYAKDN